MTYLPFPLNLSVGVRLPGGVHRQVPAWVLSQGQRAGHPRVPGDLFAPHRVPRPAALQPSRRDRLRSGALRHPLVSDYVHS